jgi:glycosyltransferase involved in cell wall biosynthesis
MLDRLYQVNLQSGFGGGEVYTAFLCRALDQLGIATTLLCHPKATYWQSLALPASCSIVPIEPDMLVSRLSEQRSWILTHGPLNSTLAAALEQKHVLTAIAHMPPQGRPKDRYRHYQCVFGVSNYVNDGLRAIEVPTWDFPLYGVAALERNTPAQQPLRQRSLYNWDQRKGRDKILSALEPWVEPLRSRLIFQRRDGLTLGIVSRLTPIKQFPALFKIIAPVLASHPEFNIEIFGCGGYASVRDLKQALQPLGKRARFWGQQGNVAAIYPQLDYLLTGLPEKEALGLNIIEAQACGTPVLAINAPPFNETIIEGSSGFFFVDPRQDGGADFDRLLSRIASLQVRIDPRLATEHLARFSFASFVERLWPIVAWAENAVSLPSVIAH